MNDNPTESALDLSIVIVAWRAREDLLRCLASIQRHAEVRHEVIVVDDGSGDGSAEAVASVHPAARLVVKPSNEGLVAGRNSALPLINAPSVLMLDADTELRPGAVRSLLDALWRLPDTGLVGPRLEGVDGELQLSCRRWPPLLIPLLRRGPYARWIDDDPPVHRRHMMKDFDHAQERPVVWVSGASQMWRADLMSRIGRYDHRLSSYGGEDLDWCLRVWGAGMQVRYVPNAVIVHRWQQVTNQSPFGRRSWRALRDWYYLQVKHRALRRDPRLSEANS